MNDVEAGQLPDVQPPPAMPYESADLTLDQWATARSAHEMNLLLAIRRMLEDFETGEAEILARELVKRFTQ